MDKYNGEEDGMLISDNENHRKLLKRCTEVWGYKAQLAMAVGECGEFLAEVGRDAQRRSSTEKFVDEIADVIIMMNQMAVYHGEDLVRERILHKLEKVRGKLDRYEELHFNV